MAKKTKSGENSDGAYHIVLLDPYKATYQSLGYSDKAAYAMKMLNAAASDIPQMLREYWTDLTSAVDVFTKELAKQKDTINETSAENMSHKTVSTTLTDIKSMVKGYVGMYKLEKDSENYAMADYLRQKLATLSAAKPKKGEKVLSIETIQNVITEIPDKYWEITNTLSMKNTLLAMLTESQNCTQAHSDKDIAIRGANKTAEDTFDDFVYSYLDSVNPMQRKCKQDPYNDMVTKMNEITASYKKKSGNNKK